MDDSNINDIDESSGPSSMLIRDYAVFSGAIKPFRLSLLIAVLYLFFGICYIYSSSHFAALITISKEQLESIELLKGFMFIFVTASFLFASIYLLLRRLQRKEKELFKQREAIAAAGKQATAGLFASSVAHDLNNILTVSHYNLQMLLESKDIKSPEKKRIEILCHVNREIQNYTQRLTGLSRRHILSGIQRTNLFDTITTAIQLAQNHTKVKKCTITTDIPEMSVAKVDKSLVERALLNSIINAAEATNAHGQIEVKIIQKPKEVRIEVHDNGPGIPPEDRERVLEPFYSTKSDGTGLGLLSIRYCSEVHNGAFGIEESYLGGACVYMVFPADDQTRSQAWKIIG